ncbi:hypothetical protein ACU686_26445 [Yinghuangia aomiensis]
MARPLHHAVRTHIRHDTGGLTDGHHRPPRSGRRRRGHVARHAARAAHVARRLPRRRRRPVRSGAAGGASGAVELQPFDTDSGEACIRLRAVPPAGTPGDDQPSHACLLGALVALGGHADVDARFFEPDALGGPDGTFHRVTATRLARGGVRLQVMVRSPQ